MNRSVKISLGLATATKRRRVRAMLREVRACMQRYTDSLWTTPGRLDAQTLYRVSGGGLSCRHRSNCLKVALETVSMTKKAAAAIGKSATKPKLRGAIRLGGGVAMIETGRGAFDYVLKLSGLVSGSPIVIPFKSHVRLNYWLAKPGARLLQGCTLGDGWAALWIEIPEEPVKKGPALGVDVGICKLMVDSDGVQYGTGMRAIMNRVRRCKPGSKGRLRASRARTNFIHREVKKLPWATIGVIGVERLTDMKRGKQPNRGKAFRKMIAPWTYRQAVERIEQLAQENRVLVIAVDPRNTSRTCPSCGTVAKENRRGESFECVGCHYSADADFVGALNVLARTRGNSGQSMGRPASKTIIGNHQTWRTPRMKLTAKSKGKLVDVRDTCADLHLRAERPEDEHVLTRLYRHLTGLESDPTIAEAFEILRQPMERVTRPNSGIVMAQHEGSTS